MKLVVILAIGILIGIALMVIGPWLCAHVHGGGGVLVSGWLMVGNPTQAPVVQPPPPTPHYQAVPAPAPAVVQPIRIEVVMPKPEPLPNCLHPAQQEFNPPVQAATDR